MIDLLSKEILILVLLLLTILFGTMFVIKTVQVSKLKKRKLEKEAKREKEKQLEKQYECYEKPRREKHEKHDKHDKYEKHEVVTLLTNLLNVGFTNLSLTEQSARMAQLLREYYNMEYVTFYIKGNDGWFSTLTTNMPKYRVTRTERYYNNESQSMTSDSKVTVLEEYEKDSFLRSINVEYSNFTLIKQKGKVIGALLLEHSNRTEVENNKTQFELYNKIFNTTSLVLSHLIEVSNLIKKVSTDQLTDVYNRRFIDVTLSEEIIKHINLGQSFYIALMDIDYFKKFNDTYGHQFGDEVLKKVSKYIKDKLGQHSWVARYGGEEFLIFIANSSPEKVKMKIESIREGVSKLEVSYGGQSASVTVSFGIAGFPQDGGIAESIISNADKALYQSKADGRNRVTVWGDCICKTKQRK